ncbi:MAG: terminase large subunit domain-containing protein [Bryobacteraceae bacterium]
MSYYLDPNQLWLAPLLRATPELRPETSSMPVDLWARTYLNFHADPVQAQILNSNTHRLAVCCCRQWGKSTVAAVKALHLAWCKPDALVLLASPSFDQSAGLLRTFRLFASRLIGEPCKGEPGRKGSILLPNQSRIVALPQSPSTVRGHAAPDLIVIDDAAFVTDETHNALSPMLAVSNGQLWLLSSPNSQSGEFNKVWHSKAQRPVAAPPSPRPQGAVAHDDPGWHRFSVTADQCPRISRDFLRRERLAKGDAIFRQEYMCEFVSHAKQAIDQRWIDEAFRGDLPGMEFKP